MAGMTINGERVRTFLDITGMPGALLAERAGVSRSTITNLLRDNGDSRFSEATHDAIEAVMRQVADELAALIGEDDTAEEVESVMLRDGALVMDDRRTLVAFRRRLADPSR